MLSEPAHLAWRNHLLDLVTDQTLEAVVAFGTQAHAAVGFVGNETRRSHGDQGPAPIE